MSATTAATTTAACPNIHEMVVVHKVFRRELRLLPMLVGRIADGDTVRAARIAGHARMVLAGLHMHHTGEDEVLWPLLSERAAPSAEVVRRMEADHERVDELAAVLDRQLTRWAATADRAAGAELTATLTELRDIVLRHLDDEEREILPLAEQHLTVAEWDSMGEHGRDAMSTRELPLMFGAIVEDATPEEQTMMLAPLPAPVRLLLRTVGAWRYRRYISAVRETG